MDNSIQSRAVTFQKNLFYLLQGKPFKNDEKIPFLSSEKLFSFSRHLIFVLVFWSCRKNGLIRNIRLVSKSMTSKLGSQTITIHILRNISRIKGNQTMKFGQLIEYNMTNIFL